jgi:hypothetical protein
VLKLLGEDIGGRPLLLVGFFAVLSAFQFLTVGVLAELLIRIYFRGPAHKHPYYLQDSSAPAATAVASEGGWYGPAGAPAPAQPPVRA